MPRKADAPKIKYTLVNPNEIDKIQPLWEGLNRLMGERTIHFKQHFATMTWEKRRFDLLKRAGCGQLHIDVAVDAAKDAVAGYLVSSLSNEKLGTVESIFVSEAYRGLGIGESLMNRALAWMDQNGAVEKVLEVTVGNERVYGFYARFGFMPRQTLLKQIKK